MPRPLVSPARVHDLVQDLIAAETGSALAASPAGARRAADNCLLCADRNASAERSAAPPPLMAGWVASRRVVGWHHGLRAKAGQPGFSEQIARLCSADDDLRTVQAMVERAVQRGWHSVCVKGGDSFVQRAQLAARARGLRVELALAPA